MDHFVLTPGDGGEPNDYQGGGGGGILVDDFGPSSNNYINGKGYGGGAGGAYGGGYGLPGMVLIEVKPK